MKLFFPLPALLLVATLAVAQDAPAPKESRYDLRYSLAVINDATFYSNLQLPLPKVLNQLLVEPKMTVRFSERWTFSSSLIGTADTYQDTATQLRVKETYAGLSAGDFDFMAGRRMVRRERAMHSPLLECLTRRAFQPTPPTA